MRVPNYYAAPGFERAGLRRRETSWIIERIADPATLFVPVWRNHNLVVEIEGGEPRAIALGWTGIGPLLGDIVAAEERLQRGEIVFLGILEERAHFALDLSPIEAPLEMLHSPARPRAASKQRVCALPICGNWAGGSTATEAALLAHARAMIYWHARHRFCGVCGSPTRAEEAGHVRRCTDPACNSMHFPRTDPAVIMLVTHGESALMGRSRHFPPGMYSTLAGFVEPGESLEDAVAREVREETGIEVGSRRLPFLAALAVSGQYHAGLSRRGADDRDYR